jgi:antitoxin (DNA-binding transcriptional repressor) of toxin-antitoxin stability system
MTNNITIEADNSSLEALLDRVSQGAEITITKNGQAVAKLISTNSVVVETVTTALSLVPTEIDDAEFQELCQAYDAAV